MKSLLAIWLFFTAMVSLSAQEVRRALPTESFSADDLAKFLAGVPVPPGSPLF